MLERARRRISVKPRTGKGAMFFLPACPVVLWAGREFPAAAAQPSLT